MAGINRRTFAVLSGWDHVVQSVEVLFTTRLGERVMLRHFTGGVADLLGRLLTPSLLSAFRVVIAMSIDLWEPRLKVRRVEFLGSVEEIRQGHLKVVIQVDYRPKGHLGDFTVEGIRTLNLGLSGSNIFVS